MSNEITPFEKIRRTNPAGHEFWSSRDFARVLGYADYRNFEAVIARARTACFNSGQRLKDHFVEITEMIGIGSGALLLTTSNRDNETLRCAITFAAHPSSKARSIPKGDMSQSPGLMRGTSIYPGKPHP